jgi:cation diffusion facilitator CzcD-associated flavoprotein CzcO
MALAVESPTGTAADPVEIHEIVIVGSGFSGIGAAIKLKEMGIRDIVILEKADELGGTWRANDYPGLVVDMPSFIYSYPFEMSPEWTRVYPTGRERRDYTDHCADKYGIRELVRCAKTVVSSEWDAERNLWLTRIEGGETIASRYFVSASGLLVHPQLPDIEGIGDFEGKAMHTAYWDWDYDLEGKRAAVIGTGATGIQVIPAIVDQVAHLDIYQRTAIWLLPRPDAAISERLRGIFRRANFLQSAIRILCNVVVEVSMGLGFVRHRKFPWIFDYIEKKLVESIHAQVDDPEIAEKLTPKYGFFCKRPSFSNVFYQVFNRDDVELVTDPIARITKNSIVTADGRERQIDTLICATGYSVFDRSCTPGFEVIGRDGKDLNDFWDENRFQAFEGASVPGFPNFFLMGGPYSAAGASYFTMIDTQSRHLSRVLGEIRRRGANYVEVRQEAHDRDFRKIKRRHQDTALFSSNCAPANSYYFDKHGDAPAVRPVTGLEHWWNSHFFSLKSYDFERRPERVASATTPDPR